MAGFSGAPQVLCLTLTGGHIPLVTTYSLRRAPTSGVGISLSPLTPAPGPPHLGGVLSEGEPCGLRVGQADDPTISPFLLRISPSPIRICVAAVPGIGAGAIALRGMRQWRHSPIMPGHRSSCDFWASWFPKSARHRPPPMWDEIDRRKDEKLPCLAVACKIPSPFRFGDPTEGTSEKWLSCIPDRWELRASRFFLGKSNQQEEQAGATSSGGVAEDAGHSRHRSPAHRHSRIARRRFAWGRADCLVGNWRKLLAATRRVVPHCPRHGTQQDPENSHFSIGS
jgi:hypothetical protein